MDFKKATDGLFAGVSHEDLADALGVSVATIRQARLNPQAKAHRTPPSNWIGAVLKLAQQQVARYQGLIDALCNERMPPSNHRKARPQVQKQRVRGTASFE